MDGSEMKPGMKFDTGKLRHSLLPEGVLKQVLAVLEFGAAKYAPDNWKKVGNARTRYYDAMHRHMEAWWSGEIYDTGEGGSGQHHLAAAICSAMFLIWLDQNKVDGDATQVALINSLLGTQQLNKEDDKPR